MIQTRTYLRPTKLGRKSKDFFVFDTETGIQEPNGSIEYLLSARPEHFIFGVVYGKINGEIFYKVINTVEEFKKEFRHKRYKNKIVYAHNAEYDLSCLYGNIYHMDPDAIFNGKFITATNGNCFFADSFNILPTSVKKIGEMIGLNKKDLGRELWSHIRDRDIDVDYCVRDCEIIYKALTNCFEETEPSFTIGSLSLKLFRKKYLKKTIKVNRDLSDRFFDSYYGGRTEAFYIGECNASVYDINSAYPWAMLNGNFLNPCTLRRSKKPQQDFFSKEFFTINGMIEATVHVHPDEKFPVLPYRYENKLLFPCGTIRGSWTLTEFYYALTHSRTEILEIHDLITGETISSPFTDFVTDLYTKRNASENKFEKYYLKLFLNNLYGKLVQRTQDKYKFFFDDLDALKFIRDEHLHHAELIKVVDGYFCRYEKEELYNHTIACWGAEITAQVRIKLHKEFTDNVLYCDTDSIFTRNELKGHKDDLSLGGWKKEEKTILNIRALKDYVYFTDDKDEILQNLKGVKKDALAYDEHGNVFKYQRMIKTRESFMRKDNLPPGTFINQVKFISGDYKKRQILKNGSTKPFVL